MKRLATAVACILLAVAAYGQPPCPVWANNGSVASSNWQYVITLADPQRHLLRVSMSIQPTSQELKIQLPVWNSTYQVRDFSQHVNWVRAANVHGKPVAVRKLDKTTWSVPNASTVEYEIAAIDPGPFGAEFTSEHAFLNLAQLLVYPVNASRGLVWVRLAGIPEDWKIATPLNPTDNPASSSTRSFCAENYDRLVDSPIEVGNFRQIKFDSGGSHYSIVVHANSDDYDPDLLKSSLQKLTAAELDWMNDRPFDRYMFIYHFPRAPGRGGMEHAYSTAIETSANRLTQDPLAFLGVSAHEFFHLWNVKRIRPQSFEPIDYTRENYTRALWFSEGVTSAVGDFMLVRSGLIDGDRFLARLAGQIREVEVRPAEKTQSVEESSLEAWLEKYPYYRSPDRSVSYYDKGQIVGVLLDLEMRRVTEGRKSLRDIFLWMNQNYAKQGKFFNDSEGVKEAVESITGAKFDEFFRRYVSGTDDIPYNDFFRSVGLRLERKSITTADPGFTAATNFGPAPVVISVAPGSEADKAHLLQNDIILSINGEDPEADVVEQIAGMRLGSTVKLKVSTRNRSRDIHYKLTSRQDVDYSFADLPDSTASQRARRQAWIRGDSEPGGSAH
jgi:predicted metalloprotease with PDZ domain